MTEGQQPGQQQSSGNQSTGQQQSNNQQLVGNTNGASLHSL